MPFLFWVVIAAAVVLAVAGFAGSSEILGLPLSTVAALVSGGVIAAWLGAGLARDSRSGLRQTVLMAAGWLVLLGMVLGVYAYRTELNEVGARVFSELVPGQPVTTTNGETRVVRRGDGTFVLEGRVNDRSVRFIVDTGASAVVLTAETAAAVGIASRPLEFSAPVQTANGVTVAAPVLLRRIEVGPIVARDVRALVARPGALRENLLGMTFLDRLGSYEFRGDTLTLRGQGSAQAGGQAN